MSRLISHVYSTVWVLVRLPYEQPVLFPFNPPGPQSIRPSGTFIPLPPPRILRRGRNFKAGGNFTHPSGAGRVGGFTLDLHADTHGRVAFKSSEYFCSHLPLTFSLSCCCSQLCKPAVLAKKLIYFITGTHGDGALTHKILFTLVLARFHCCSRHRPGPRGQLEVDLPEQERSSVAKGSSSSTSWLLLVTVAGSS